MATVTLASIVLVLLVAGGLLHDLGRDPIVLLSAAVCAAEIFFGRKSLPSFRIAPSRLLRPTADAVRTAPFTAAIVVVAAAALAWRLVIAYVMPVYAYDALNYHMPTVAEWIRSGRLAESPVNECCAGYPANGELFVTWVGVLVGTDTWVDGVQIVCAALGAVATAGIARLAGLGRSASVLAGSLFVITPVVLAQANIPHTDVTVASLLLVSMYFLLAWLVADDEASRRRTTLLLLGGVAAGMAVGTKLNALPTAATMAVLVAVQAYRVATARRIRASVGQCAVFIGPVVAFGGYWYLRDVTAHGNPIYPFRLVIAGHVVFAGAKSIAGMVTAPPAEIRGDPEPLQVLHSWARDVMFWRFHSAPPGQRLGGLGPLWGYLGTWLTLAMAVWAWRHRNRPLLVFLLLVGVSCLAQPYPWWSRFTIPLAAAGSVAIALGVEHLGRRWSGQALRTAVVALALISVAIASWRPVWYTAADGQPRSYTAADVIRLAREPPRARTFARLIYPPYRWLDALGGTVTIAIDPRFVHRTSPLAGPRFTRRLLRLPTGGYEPLDRFLAQHRPAYVIVRRGSAAQRWAERRGMDELPDQGRAKVVAYRVPVRGRG